LKPHEHHKAHSPKKLKVAVITASTSRFMAKLEGKEIVDESGRVAVEMLEKMGHEVHYIGVLNDDLWMIRITVVKLIDGGYDVIIITGGTGISPRDVTVEAVKPLFDKEIIGWGEVFRSESYKRIGVSAALTRTVAGVANGKVVIALPGSPEAVKLSMELLADELAHMVFISRGGKI